MAEYNIGFSEKLNMAARIVWDEDPINFESIRTVLYLSSLSSEISLKALLEKAGMPVKDIRAHSHNLIKLLDNFTRCQIKREIAGSPRWVPATSIFSEDVDCTNYFNATVGEVLSGE